MADSAKHFVESPNRNYSKLLDAGVQGKSVLHCSQPENAQMTGLHSGSISADPSVNSTSRTTFLAPE
jgi:hypothetical protein